MEHVDEETYRGRIPGLSATDIKQLWRSPAHYRQHVLEPPEPTPAMAFGAAVHMAVLEPARYAENYAVCDDFDICEKIGGARPRQTNRYRDWYAEFLLENAGKAILDMEDYDAVAAIVRALSEHTIAKKFLSGPGTAEGVLQWTHPGTGTQMKCRPDWLADFGQIVDLKTCRDARPRAFSNDIWEHLYHLQAAVYREGVHMTTGAIEPFIFVSVEKAPPYGIMVYELDERTMELAESEADRCIRVYEECSALNHWPAYRDELRQIALPPWANVTEVS